MNDLLSQLNSTDEQLRLEVEREMLAHLLPEDLETIQASQKIFD
jgi:hypothetical protein